MNGGKLRRMDLNKLEKLLELHEGKRNLMYVDSEGVPTIGIGHNLQKPISDKAVSVIFQDDIKEVFTLLDKYLPWWRTMSENRQLVIADMAFNLGVGPSSEDPTGNLLEFKNTLKAMREGRYNDAAEGMGNSKWAVQVGSRAVRLQKMMREG